MNHNDVFFTIITVCYNSEGTIQRTITSVLNQSFQNYEYIIIDGNSTDNTIKVIESNKSKFNGRLKYLSEADEGIYFAMNKGISMAKGKYIGLINSDDWYEENTLEIIYKNYEQEPDTDIFYGLMKFYKNNRYYKTESFHHDFLEEECLTHPTCFVKNEIYKNVGLFDTKYSLASDYDFLLKCKNKNSNFRFIPQILANFSWDGSTIVHLLKSKREALKIKHKYSIYNKKQYFTEYMKVTIANYLSVIKKKFFFWF